MKRITLSILLVCFAFISYSHPWKPSSYVIVDTDGGVDDMKALSMLLASRDVRVLAITVSPGVLDAGMAYIKTKSMLNSYHHEGIPVGINRAVRYVASQFPAAMESKWGDEAGISPSSAPDCIDVIEEMLLAEKTKIRFISLGSLSTAYHAYNNIPIFREQVKEIVWSAEGAGDTSGFNYAADKESTGRMLKQKEIPVAIVNGFSAGDTLFYDSGLIASISGINTTYARKISWFLGTGTAKDHKFSYGATDEMVPLYIHYPGLFNKKTSGNTSIFTPSGTEVLRKSTIKILKGETVVENQVIKEMPEDPLFYFEDIQPYVKEIIEKYGHDEWVSGVIANEMHRHLGVFAIIGVKMGIRAREYFNTGVDEFHAVTYAGSVPPLSCMNDGIQVSTGATPGHGLLTVSDDPVKRPAVEFTYLNRKIKVSLRPEIADKISSELKEINFIYGLDSNIYWELVRQNSIKYWLSLSRHEIFQIEEVH